MGYDKNIKAKALVFSALHTDEEAADKYGMTRQSLYNWRQQLDTDNELQRLCTEYWMEVRESESWVQDATQTLRTILSALREAADETDKSDPEAFEALVDGFGKVGEILQMARIIDARLGESRQDDLPDRQDDAGQIPGE